METTIVVKSVIDKQTQAGKVYWLVSTEQHGLMAVWDAIMAETLRKSVGTPLGVELAVKGDFKNIKKILPAPVASAPGQADKFAEARAVKNTTMYVSYAKDLYLSLMMTANPEKDTPEKVMAVCIALVKQAIKEFE